MSGMIGPRVIHAAPYWDIIQDGSQTLCKRGVASGDVRVDGVTSGTAQWQGDARARMLAVTCGACWIAFRAALARVAIRANGGVEQ
ncbi:MAG: hypothetical protein Q8S13_04610 [Dehalococcoidia bacterium]|nr:hypothetical protein [Dehalococcoidia bacterium]